MRHVRRSLSGIPSNLRCGDVVLLLIVALGTMRSAFADSPETLKRLQTDLSLGSVAANHVEVGNDDVAGLATPITQRIPIQVKNHPDVVALHPDLSLTLGSAKDSCAIGFALGTPLKLPEITSPVHELHKGYQPIVKSQWKVGDVAMDQIVFGFLPCDEAVVTGNEKQDVLVRVVVRNMSDGPTSTSLVLLTGLADDSQNANIGYGPFLSPISRWQHKERKVETTPGLVLVDGKVLLAYHTSVPTPVSLQPEFEAVHGPDNKVIQLNHGLRFELSLQPKETRNIDFVLAGNSRLYPESERERLAAMNFEQALAIAEARWDRILETGMKLTTPEPRLNNVYKHFVLSNLTNVRKDAGTNWVRPNHHFLWPDAIWPWEFARVSIPLDSLGYHKDMEACLQYFVEHQSGVGKHGEEIGPEGEIRATRGCYVGTPFRWMCTTGSVLSAMAGHYRYSRDSEWLKSTRPSILAAWDWIQNERNATRVQDGDGKRVAHFGLLPKGRPHDWKEHQYFYTFSDAYTYWGMAAMAVAFREAGLPEADRLVNEAVEYRQCILDAMHRAEFVDPTSGLSFVPNNVYCREGERGGVWILDGPIAMFDTGILDPVADAKYWDSMSAVVERCWGPLGGLMSHFRGNDSDGLGEKTDTPVWYCNCAEMTYYRCFLARGELEKSLLVFYTNSYYGMSQDLLQTVERVNVKDSNFAPFQPNASGNGRMLDMMRRMIIDEQDEAQGTLWLLRGCPRRWFAAGKSIVVEDAPTLFGRMAMRTTCSKDTITIDVDAPADRPLKQLCVHVRHPDRRNPSVVKVNGQPAAIHAELVTIAAPSGHLQIVAEYAQ